MRAGGGWVGFGWVGGGGETPPWFPKITYTRTSKVYIFDMPQVSKSGPPPLPLRDHTQRPNTGSALAHFVFVLERGFDPHPGPGSTYISVLMRT